MFERFPDSARRVLALAQEEAKGLGHGFIGTEHLLLAVGEEDGGVGQRVLSRHAMARTLRREITDLHRGQARPAAGHIPFTAGAKRSLELAHRQCEALGLATVDGAVLLLGMLEEHGGASQVLSTAGVDLDALRREVVEALTEAHAAPAAVDVGEATVEGISIRVTAAIREALGHPPTGRDSTGRVLIMRRRAGRAPRAATPQHDRQRRRPLGRARLLPAVWQHDRTRPGAS